MVNKTAVITGGSSGIGLASAIILKKQFKNIIVIDIENSNELMSLGLDFRSCDLADADQIKKVIEGIASDYEQINGLVNNAGVLSYGSVTELSIDDWEKVMNVNIRAPFLCSKYVIPEMVNGGVIVNVASIQSFFAQPKVAAYATSKAAILGLTRSIAIDYAGHIRCVAVCPGTIDTPMLHNALNQSDDPKSMMNQLNASHLTGRIGTPEEVAELIAFVCSDKCQFINGSAIRVDGGLGVNLGGSID